MQVIRVGEIGKRLVERDDVRARKRRKLRLQLAVKRRQALDIARRVLLVCRRVRRVGLGQPVRDVLHLLYRAARIQPDVRVIKLVMLVMLVVRVRIVVVRLVAGEHGNALARVDDRQIRAQGEHLIHKLLHPAAVDDQRVRALQRHHVAGLELIIVQTADVLLRHVLHRHAVDSVRHVERQHIHRVKARDDRGLPVRLRRAARGKQRQKRRRQRPNRFFLHRECSFPWVKTPYRHIHTTFLFRAAFRFSCFSAEKG